MSEQNIVQSDIAELMKASSKELAQPGQVLVQTETGLKPSSKRADPTVVGVYTDSFKYVLGDDKIDNQYPVGIAGRVRVLVKEKLEIGDLLVSDIGAFATKATEEEKKNKGVIIGKVLQNKEDNSIERINILILNS